MNIEEYQKLALRTESKVDNIELDVDQFNHILSAFVTVGEMLDCIKKKVYYHNPKKYDTKFEDLSSKLRFFADAIYRHHADPEPETALKDIDPRVMHSIIGICTESAELATALQKNLNGHELDTTNVQEELGDMSWYTAIINDVLKFNPHVTMDRNIAKLEERYPKLRFDDEDAENRHLSAERKILEGK